MNNILLIYITAKDTQEAKKISAHLLAHKLIACANIHSIESMYWWKNDIETNNESVVIAKTTKENYEAIIENTKKMHSYETPCIMSIESQCNKEYFEWIQQELRK